MGTQYAPAHAGMEDQSNPEDPERLVARRVRAVCDLIYSLCRDEIIDENHATVAMLAVELGSRQSARYFIAPLVNPET